ncbi:nickel pincer cofactor biosynthesis protein LarB [Fusibacter sp. 3D3]|uniref:nickel pincer cofactor biosynthesis protein LarB n=1 Tax=Fusibacter sp. 3D3 TaxID=1048380 RepID=UPI00085358C9|nr:nickel pincer cofactor biosynthesis protein LarB [Fusibacter sp. 3D3]GAU78148.1 NCAIR mutase PurE-related protein [Fusibacter sp. 3D3]
MNQNQLESLLQKVKQSEVTIEDAMKTLSALPFDDLGFAMIDHHRHLRVGYPEVIYCEGKTTEQVIKIFDNMSSRHVNVLATRASAVLYEAIKPLYMDAKYNEAARVITLTYEAVPMTDDYIAIVAAGTSDLPVVEEAYETAVAFGNRVEKVVDVGVAGIHRLFARLDVIRGAKVVVVVAGMEGALASVVAGLVDKPVIAVPTSVGYGASFGGISALLTMLNSCASGVTVVNIDNGFGAAYAASQINRL